MKRASGFDYLRTVAVSRLMLDNLPNIQSSWLTQGPKLGQIGLQYGVNDMGSTILEENVVSKASVFMVPLPRSSASSKTPASPPPRRNTKYELLPAA
ncbi:MAG: hypothetical protein MZW92_38630 [Comamonadaceae bacterium]|nr:hypothetical protein [Comamonadaceae bacterium]